MKVSNKFAKRVLYALFFIIACLWFFAIANIAILWIFGVEVLVDREIDLTFLTLPLLILSVLNSGIWLLIYIIYPIANRHITRWQKRLITAYRKIIRSQKESISRRLIHMPKVSVIIPARNEESVIAETISSCINQTWPDVEVIVVCHNCSDKTYNNATTLARQTQRPVKVFDYNTTQAGKGIALNFALENTTGDYVCILDSGSTLAPDYFETALLMFASDEKCAAVQGKLITSNSDYNMITKLLSLEYDLFGTQFMAVRSFLEKRCTLAGTGCIIRKDVLVKIGGFNNVLIEDYELAFRLLRNKYRIIFAPLSVVYDEQPPAMDIIFRQRSRWVKGHMDLLKDRVAEPTDFIGTLYWLSPITMLASLMMLCISAYSVVHGLVTGYYPFVYAYIPFDIWLVSTFLIFGLQSLFIMSYDKNDSIGKKLKKIGYAALMMPFGHYWYVVTIRAFFVKGWANTKTSHGFEKEITAKT